MDSMEIIQILAVAMQVGISALLMACALWAHQMRQEEQSNRRVARVRVAPKLRSRRPVTFNPHRTADMLVGNRGLLGKIDQTGPARPAAS